jgi:hypothetical protein
METFSAAAICGGTGPGDTPLDCCPLNSGMIPKIEIATQKDGSLKLLKSRSPSENEFNSQRFPSCLQNYMDCFPSALYHFMDCRRQTV